MAAVSEDDIIKRRLLIEGDGGGDDRRISSVTKMFIKWASNEESEEESFATYQKMLAMLAQSEFAMEKGMLVHNMNLEEQANYESLNKQIESSIQDAHKRIIECKQELQQAKRIRKNRQEYDTLAKKIQEHPDRQKTQKELEILNQELEAEKAIKQNLDDKLQMRRKQFHVLIAAIREMQRLIEDDEVQESAEPERTPENSNIDDMETS